MPDSRHKCTAFSINRSLQCGDKIITLDKPLVMGILNLTPDSFFDGGRYQEQDQFISHSEKMLEEGADILDLGAVSTRPGAAEVSEREELKRLIPALQILVKRFPQTIFSVDTYRSNVAKVAADNGAGIINDISGGNLDNHMFETIATLNTPYVLMHMKGEPSNMQQNPVYQNVVAEVSEFFESGIGKLKELGFSQVILDPGFGFGKTIPHNYALLRHLDQLRKFGFPVLVGISRKSMINKLLDIKSNDALHATGVLNTIALLGGADILRVHDVKEAIQVIKVVNAFQNEGV
jgi:dihydropteroate synthase